jgi:hypothetical protein
MMEPTIVQNGALYEAQHRHTKRHRKYIRLRQTEFRETMREAEAAHTIRPGVRKALPRHRFFDIARLYLHLQEV